MILYKSRKNYISKGVFNIVIASAFVNSYAYNTSSGPFFSALKSQTDNLENVTYYFNDITSTGVVSASVDGATGNGTAVFADIWGNVEKSLPVVSGSSTGYTAQTSAESVEYGYNAKNQLSTITTDSTVYTFTYDSHGNQSVIKAGANTLATYTYNSNNGKLKKVTYGNGFAIEYFYNELENISEIWYTVNGAASVAYRYS